MNFTVTTEYALRIMSFMVTDEHKIHTTKELFEHLDIPFRYLRKLMISMSKSDILDSIRGKNGGYKIARSPKEITLLQIIESTGENPLGELCFFGNRECDINNKCMMHDKWMKVRENMAQVLSTTTLEEIKDSENLNYIISQASENNEEHQCQSPESQKPE